MRGKRIDELLRELPVPDEEGARDRALRLVRAAQAEGAPSPPPKRRGRRLGLVLVSALVLSALLLSPAGADVRGWVGDVVSSNDGPPAPALTSLPGGGRLLVQSAAGPWVVQPGGSQRLLGHFGEATWSPRGLYVAVTDGHRLTAVEPDGDPRWTITSPGLVTSPRWSPSGYRVAYRAGASLRVVAGDGTGDSLLAAHTTAAPPSWRPGPGHVLAFLDAAGRARVLNTDSRRILFATGGDRSRISLAWSSDGSRLLVLSPTQLLVFDGSGRRLGDLTRPTQARFAAAAFQPGSHRFGLILRYGTGTPRERSEVYLRGFPVARRLLFSGLGRFEDLIWSPAGDRLLVSWREADQWTFIPLGGRGRTQAVGDVRRQFAPGAAHPAFPAVDGWCCPP